MHLASLTLHPERFPVRDRYPFSLPQLQRLGTLAFDAPVTFFVGENGTGKSTLLEAVAARCGIHIWRDESPLRVEHNRWELDEPESALSPRSQLELLRILARESAAGHAQFIVATHSPILLACPGAAICSFDAAPPRRVAYEQTELVRLYRAFLADPQVHLRDAVLPLGPG